MAVKPSKIIYLCLNIGIPSLDSLFVKTDLKVQGNRSSYCGTHNWSCHNNSVPVGDPALGSPSVIPIVLNILVPSIAKRILPS